jgi:hypothetical protein
MPGVRDDLDYLDLEESGRDAGARLVIPEGVMTRWRRDDDRYGDLGKR